MILPLRHFVVLTHNQTSERIYLTMKKFLLYALCLQICALNYGADRPANQNHQIPLAADIIELPPPRIAAQREPNFAMLLSPEILCILLKNRNNWDLMPLVYATEQALDIPNPQTNTQSTTHPRSKRKRSFPPDESFTAPSRL
jgi:hypothetical protein